MRGDTLAVILLLFSYSAGRSLSYMGIVISSADDKILSLLKADTPAGEFGDFCLF